MQKPELLAPAGNLEKLKMAIVYGADAVYIGGEKFGLRAYADNFSEQDMLEGIKFAHERGKKVYVTVNIIPHNEDLKGIPNYIKRLKDLGIDAVIVSDPGVLSIIQEVWPECEIHLSTQANTTNYKSACFWHKLGVKRIILARELSINEIKEIKENTPQDLELETFVHGAMCISYSGRCLLSNYLAQRDANRGECAHPCRWKYYLMEEKRPGEYIPVFEDQKGTYFFNSKDLCMIEHLPQLIESGVSSFKIEGRIKSAYYVATVVRSYRKVIDEYFRNPQEYKFNSEWLDEIKKVSHREFTTGFYFNKPTGDEQIYEYSSYIRDYSFVGKVLEYDENTKIATIEQRNRMFVGDEVEVVSPDNYFVQKITSMTNEEGEEIEVAPHPQMIVKMPMLSLVTPYTMLRKKNE